jgi:hypothetical protein
MTFGVRNMNFEAYHYNLLRSFVTQSLLDLSTIVITLLSNTSKLLILTSNTFNDMERVCAIDYLDDNYVNFGD